MISRDQSHFLSFNQSFSYCEDLKHLLKNSKTNRSVETKFHIEPPGGGGGGGGGRKGTTFPFYPGHMINLTAMLIFSEIFKNKSSLEPMNRWP